MNTKPFILAFILFSSLIFAQQGSKKDVKSLEEELKKKDALIEKLEKRIQLLEKELALLKGTKVKKGTKKTPKKPLAPKNLTSRIIDPMTIPELKSWIVSKESSYVFYNSTPKKISFKFFSNGVGKLTFTCRNGVKGIMTCFFHKNGKPKSGSLFLKYTDGFTYHGQSQNGHMHGKGRIFYEEGNDYEEYTGKNYQGNPLGLGTMKYRNGNIRMGEWVKSGKCRNTRKYRKYRQTGLPYDEELENAIKGGEHLESHY